MAGVIGRKRFLYDLWGDAVNVASRLEERPLPTASRCRSRRRSLAGRYLLEARGNVELKGKGPTRAYFLVRRANGDPAPAGAP